MQTYQNTTDRSCVYDAFKMAGLPTTPEMMNGITGNEVVVTLKSHGYLIALKGETVTVNGHFFIIRDFKKDFAHIEYHESVGELSDLTPEDIGVVAYLDSAE